MADSLMDNSGMDGGKFDFSNFGEYSGEMDNFMTDSLSNNYSFRR